MSSCRPAQGGDFLQRESSEAVALRYKAQGWFYDQKGQVVPLVAFLLMFITVGTVVLGAVAKGVGKRSREQKAADLSALAGARTMRALYPRLFEPPTVLGKPNPRHLERSRYLQLGSSRAEEIARRNGAARVRVSFPDGKTLAPVRIRVTVSDSVTVETGRRTRALKAQVKATAEAELAPPGQIGQLPRGDGEYTGPLVYRQGKPMRPDVALAFDRMAKAAKRSGISLIVVSGFRSNAEQAALFAARPDPRWVAPPGKSLHRLGTELDLGPASAYGWLAANAGRFHFIKRYAWEPWHFGYTLNAGTRSVGFGSGGGGLHSAHSSGSGEEGGRLQSFVPERYAPAISSAAQRWNVSAALLAAQLYAESGFNPFAVSPAGARGIAQFMPATAQSYGLRNPFNATDAIDAQAHLMRDLLRRFGSVPLALAAYNAGPGAVAGCSCIPPYPETRGYVARILGLLGGAGDVAGALATSRLAVRLIE